MASLPARRSYPSPLHHLRPRLHNPVVPPARDVAHEEDWVVFLNGMMLVYMYNNM